MDKCTYDAMVSNVDDDGRISVLVHLSPQGKAQMPTGLMMDFGFRIYATTYALPQPIHLTTIELMDAGREYVAAEVYANQVRSAVTRAKGRILIETIGEGLDGWLAEVWVVDPDGGELVHLNARLMQECRDIEARS